MFKHALYFILWTFNIFFFCFISLFVIWRNSIEDTNIKNLPSEKSSSKETTWIYRIFARFVPRFSPRENRAENFTRGILPWRAGGLVDWRWVACPSWPFRLHHPNILSTAFLKRFLVSTCYLQFSPLFLLRFREPSSPPPSFLSLLKIPRTSHSSSRNSSASGASRNARWDSLYLYY